MDLGFYITKLREEHQMALPLCLMWTAHDVIMKLPDGAVETEESCMRILDDVLVENEDQIIELINNLIAEHIYNLYK